MTFPEATGVGQVTSPFNWEVVCDKLNLKEKDTFDVMFIVVDVANKCRIYQADTLNVQADRQAPGQSAARVEHCFD